MPSVGADFPALNGDTPHRLAAGHVGLLLPAHRERFEFDAEVATRHSWVQAHVPDLSAALEDRLERLSKVLAPSPALDALVREAVAAAAGALPSAPWVLAHLAAAALWRYVGEAEPGGPERSRPVDDATRFIHTHLHDPSLTLDQIARAAHVTPAHLIRSFRAEHGTTPMAYLWQRRVALGVDLLTNTGLGVSAVAERCGFKTVHHLSRRIKQATGLPPAALRRGSGTPRSRACVGQRVELREPVPPKRAGAPGVAAVGAFPQLAVRQTGEEPLLGRDEGVGHRREGIR